MFYMGLERPVIRNRDGSNIVPSFYGVLPSEENHLALPADYADYRPSIRPVSGRKHGPQTTQTVYAA